MKKIKLLYCSMLFAITSFSQTYTFIGNGLWSNSTNWVSNQVPPSTLPIGSTIYISPAPGDSCVLNVSQTISTGASLTISSGSVFIISGNFYVAGSLPLVTTNPVTGNASDTAVSGGNILANGGSSVTQRGIVWSLNPNPTTNDNKISNGAGSGSFSSILSYLSSGSVYHVRAYAKNSTGTAYGNDVSFTEGQPASVVICNQEWTKNNLSVTTYRNGDIIPQITNHNQWDTMTTGGWCYFGFAVYDINGSEYGKWYNQYAIADPRGLAPAGWHIPCAVEWATLANCTGGPENAGKALKEVGASHWNAPNTATNTSGFTGLGGGRYTYSCGNVPACWGSESGLAGNAYINSFNQYGIWWSNTETSATNGQCWATYYNGDGLSNFSGVKYSAFSVRCIKGDSNQVCSNSLPVVITDSATSITHTSAKCWGTTPLTNTFWVTERGFVWDTLSNPTIASHVTTAGTGTGSFSSTLSGMVTNKIYFVKAYAKNRFGISYGPEISFTTLGPQLPVVQTTTISNDNSSAIVGGRVTDDGQSPILTQGVVWSTSPHPVITGNSSAGSGVAPDFAAAIANLLPNAVYYVRTYASNVVGLTYGNEITVNTTNVLPQSVVVCNSVWAQKNLDVSIYRNGDPIPQVTDSATWVHLTTGAWCWYKNDSATYAATYGKLYNWYAVNDSRGLAPAGMHVPSSAEWYSFFTCLGGYNAAGSNATREAGTAHWQPNAGATNSSAFTGLPGGRRDNTGFDRVNKDAIWWSTSVSTFSGAQYASCIDLEVGYVFGNSWLVNSGISVRCIRD